MPSKTAIQRHRDAEVLMLAAARNLDIVTTALLERLEEDGALEILASPTPPEPLPDEQTLALPAPVRAALASARAIRESMGPVELPDLSDLQRVFISLLAFYIEKVLLTDDAHQFEVQWDFLARETRDEAAQSAYDTMVSVRQVVTGALGSRTADAVLGLTGPTPDVPFVLRDVLGAAVDRIRNNWDRFPSLRIEGVQVTWVDLADQLEKVLEPLDDAIRAVQEEENAAKVALREKRETLEAQNNSLVGFKGMLRGMTIAANLRDLARELEPPGRRSSSGPTEVPELPPGPPEPPSDLPSLPDAETEEVTS